MTGTSSKGRRDYRVEGHGANFVLKTGGPSLALEAIALGNDQLGETVGQSVDKNKATTTTAGFILATPSDTLGESVTSLTVV